MITHNKNTGVSKTTGKAVRLVVAGEQVVAMIHGTDFDTTGSKHQIIEFATEAEAKEYIVANGLIYDAEVEYG